jgi:competence protein ComEC
MMAWLAACAAWLAGVAWQLAEPALAHLAAYGWAALAAVGWLAVTWLGYRRWGLGRRGSQGVTLGASNARWPKLAPATLHVSAVLGVAVLAWALTGWRAHELLSQQLPQAWQGHDVSVEVQLVGLPQPTPGGVLFDARVLRWPDEVHASAASCCLPTQLSLRMNNVDVQTLSAGQRWRFSVRLHAPDGLSNPAGFDPTLSYFERGVRAIGQVRERGNPPFKLSDEPEQPWQGVIDRFRQRTRAGILNHVHDPRAAGVIAGLSVGDQSAIDRDDWQVFRRTGVAHLVSISGAHIAMFGWLAAAVVRRLWARWPVGVHRVPAPVVARWSAVLASALYALIAGWGVPAQRTVWMMLIMTVLRHGGRRWPWPLVWLVSAVLLTALDPWALRQAGFWLSYVAVAVLMASGSAPSQSTHEVLDVVDASSQGPAAPAKDSAVARAGAALASASAAARHAGGEMWHTQWQITLALTPLAAVCFGQVSVVSVVSNLGAIPLFTLAITPLALLGMVWSPFWTLDEWLVRWILHELGNVSVLSWAVVQAPALPWWVAAGVIMAGFVQALSLPWRWRLMAWPFLLPLFYLPHSWRLLPEPAPGQFQVLAADVGQGTAVLLRTAHHSLLFDAGPRIGTQSDAGDRVLLPLMRALGLRGLDVLLISHQDTDHVGGAAAIVKEISIGRLLTSLDKVHPLRQAMGVQGGGLPHEACVAGQHWVWDGVDFTVLHPTLEDYARRAQLPSNALSCVLKVSLVAAPAVSALLTGDIEAEQEAALLARMAAPDQSEASASPTPTRLRSTVLVAPHHGSKTSSTTAFLQAVQPEQVVIQVGRRNAYKHPSPPVLKRYQAMGLPWQSTPLCGAWVWHSDEGSHTGTSKAQASASAADGTAVGHCWRSDHRHYWDGALPGWQPAATGAD